MDKTLFAFGSFLGFLAVAAGAFGGHALKARLEPEMLVVFEVGARYHIYHALAVLIVAVALAYIDSSILRVGGWLFGVGVIIFSGSLYLLALTGIRKWGMVTPIGGLLFLSGWASCFLSVFLKR